MHRLTDKAHMLLQQGNPAQAEKLAREALALVPEDTYAHREIKLLHPERAPKTAAQEPEQGREKLTLLSLGS